MKSIPINATNIECKFDGKETMITFMNENKYNMHSFIGEYEVKNFKLIKVKTK